LTARRPRVLVATPDFPPATGGIQTLLGEVARRLPAFDVRVVTARTPGSRRFDAGSGVATWRLPRVAAANRASVLALNAGVAGAAVAWRPDVVLSGHAVLVPATDLVRGLLRRPVVQYAHANEFDRRPGLAARAVRGAAATIAVSRYTQSLALRAGADPARVRVIHPGTDAAGRDPGAPRAPQPTLVTVSRLAERYKGHDLVLRALPEIRRAVPAVQWLVIGDGPLRGEYEALAAELGVADAVRFEGRLSDAERDRRLNAAHVFVLPSRLRPSGGGGEGFGIVYLEAAAHGLPVVAGAVAGALDAVEDGSTGRLVDPEDPAALAEALIDLLTHPERAAALGEAGARRAREQFSWDAVAARVQDVLLECCAGP
jgi:phosphatidylinositol alpha-1,6-mannosyltransferase